MTGETDPETKPNEGQAVVERVWTDIVNDGDLDAVDELVAESYTYRGPGGYELAGPEGFRRFVGALHEIFEDLSVSVHEYIVDEGRVLSRWTGRGTDRKTGKEITWEGATITHVADGKMVDDWEYWDRLELAEQMADGWLEERIVQTVSRRATKDLPTD